MNLKITERALEKVAQKEGVSVDEIKREIEMAIGIAYSNPDPKIQSRWKNIPKKGKIPTPEEVIAQLAKEVRA